MFNPFTMLFAVPRGDDLETLARRARARYDAMSPADNVVALQKAEQEVIAAAFRFADTTERRGAYSYTVLMTDLDNLMTAVGSLRKAKDALRHV